MRSPSPTSRGRARSTRGAQDRLVVAGQQVHGHRPPSSHSGSRRSPHERRRARRSDQRDPAEPRPRPPAARAGRGDGGHGVDPAVPQPTGAITTGADGRHGAGQEARPAGRRASPGRPPAPREVGQRATSDSRPNTSRLGTATPSLGAERDAERQSPAGRAGAAAAPAAAPSAVTPAVAPTDSQNPTDQASSGSSSSRPITATASSRSALALAAEGERGRAERGHRAGPQHRRLGPGQHDEPARSAPASAPTGSNGRRPPQQRPGGGQQERHVLPATPR